MIAPQHQPPQPQAPPADRWHPAPEAYRPPESGGTSLWSTMQDTVQSVASKHPVLVVVAAASLGALLGCLVKKR